MTRASLTNLELQPQDMGWRSKATTVSCCRARTVSEGRYVARISCALVTGGTLGDLGTLIRSQYQVFDYPDAWAGILVACLYGIGFYLAIALAERLTLRWQPSTFD